MLIPSEQKRSSVSVSLSVSLPFSLCPYMWCSVEMVSQGAQVGAERKSAGVSRIIVLTPSNSRFLYLRISL